MSIYSHHVQGEQWHALVDYPGAYEVSNLGRVRNGSGHVLKAQLDPFGYPTVRLRGDGRRVGKRVHRLVAESFLGPCPAGSEVRHLDGNPTNNQVENLAYGTRRANNLDAVRHGTNGNTRKTHCPQGHPYDAENTWRPPSQPNARVCRRCASERQKRNKPWRARRAKERAAQ